jgi:demethylmenaquinone methyltransferase/2-methoxy-6-polyprenyl-1,4-benzoquinol methylase
MRSADEGTPETLLDEQVRYYQAVAAEYADHALPFPGASELAEALDAFQPTGSVLELACGPGTWTTQLLRHTADLTAVDASSEMLALASARVGKQRVRFVSADLFHWRPDRRYDVVFFGFWLSHVPPDRFASFWSLVAECLKPDGRVFFVDDGYRTADELIQGVRSSTIQRRLMDGTAYRIVKVPHQPVDLERQLDRIGWRIKVHSTSGPFFWGAGGHNRRKDEEPRLTTKNR